VNERTQIDHDRLFKELLENFFIEFLSLFFPEACAAIDLEHLKFLQQEVFTDVVAGEKHVVDLLAETKLKGEDGLILVHVENQAQVQQDFAKRMFVYFARLYQKFQCRILPIAIFSYGEEREEPDSFQLGFPFLNVLQFRFHTLVLKKCNWRDYITSDNPVAAALLSKMGYKQEEKVRVKVEFIRILTRLQLDPARMQLLAGFFETYLKLNRIEEEEFLAQVRMLGPQEECAVMEITTSWHEKGRVEGQIELVLKQIRKRFGFVPEEIAVILPSLTPEKIEALGEALVEVASIEEFQAMVH